MECQTPDCREDLIKVLDKKMDKVSWKTVVLILISFLGLVWAVTSYSLDTLRHDREQISRNSNNISLIQKDLEDLEFIKITVNQTQKDLGDIKTKIDTIYLSPKELKKLIKQAVKEGNR